MQTLLDETRYTDWFTESATLGGRTFRLALHEAPDDFLPNDPRLDHDGPPGWPGMINVMTHFKRRVIVEFENVIYLQVFDEFARNLDDDETREPHILARHSVSALKKWIEEYTVLFFVRGGEEKFTHYSVLTTDNIYHVVTDKEPRVFEEAGTTDPPTLAH